MGSGVLLMRAAVISETASPRGTKKDSPSAMLRKGCPSFFYGKRYFLRKARIFSRNSL